MKRKIIIIHFNFSKLVFRDKEKLFHLKAEEKSHFHFLSFHLHFVHLHHSHAVFDLVQEHLFPCSRDDSSDDAAVCSVEVWLLCRRMELELLSVSVVGEVLRLRNENMFAFSSSGIK